MQPQILDLDTTELTLQQVMERVLTSGRITSAQRMWLHQLIMADLTLAPETLLQVRRVFDRLQMGLIKVID
jgi:phage I-like protein